MINKKIDFFQSTFTKDLGLGKQTTLDKFLVVGKFIEKIKPAIDKSLSRFLTKAGISEVIEAIRKTVVNNIK